MMAPVALQEGVVLETCSDGNLRAGTGMRGRRRTVIAGCVRLLLTSLGLMTGPSKLGSRKLILTLAL